MSSFVEMPCPHCHTVIRTNARYIGMRGPCPNCGKTIQVEAPAGQVFEPVVATKSTAAGTTEANVLIAALLGAALCIVLYIGFFIVRHTYLGELFVDRGVIPPITTFVTCWGAAILLLKYLAVKRQLAFSELELEFIPLQLGMQITSENVDAFLHHVEGLPERAKGSIIGRRIRGALEYFRSRSSVPEVQSYLSSHAEIDASTVDSGYTIVRAIIWTVPILGFIGTVLGISAAVTGLAATLDSEAPAAAVAPNDAADASATGDSKGAKMIEAMGLVTQGLAVAFDTTFVALVMAILLLFPAESLKRVEYRMLDRIEAFTHEALLRRMSDRQDNRTLTPEIAKLIEPAFRQHQQWLMEWQKQVAQLGNVIGMDFERHMQHLQNATRGASDAQLNEARQTAQLLGGSVTDLTRCMQQFREINEGGTAAMQSSLHAAQQVQERINSSTRQMLEAAGSMAALTPAPRDLDTERLAEAAGALERAASRLENLAAASPTHHADGNHAAPRGGIFRIFGKR